MNITILQTADSTNYKRILELTASVNEPYAKRFDISYKQFVGLKRGYFPWHACFNRIVWINELIEAGHTGWVFYLDADAYIYGQDIDVRDIIAQADGKPAIFGPGGDKGHRWDVNDGVFLVDLDSPIVKELMARWLKDFMGTTEDDLKRAENWQDVPSDQPRLHRILSGNTKFLDAIHMADRHVFNDYKASFIRQALRGHGFTMDERVAMVERDIISLKNSLPL
jgi:hypothetical protein